MTARLGDTRCDYVFILNGTSHDAAVTLTTHVAVFKLEVVVTR